MNFTVAAGTEASMSAADILDIAGLTITTLPPNFSCPKNEPENSTKIYYTADFI